MTHPIPVYPRRLGEEFCQLLESLDPARLPVHDGDATTVVVTIPLESLRTDLASAELLGAGPSPATRTPTPIPV